MISVVATVRMKHFVSLETDLADAGSNTPLTI